MMQRQPTVWASARGRFAFVCPYCGAALDVDEHDVTSLVVEARVGEPCRIDVGFLSKHQCSA